MPSARDAYREALERVAGRYDPRVLEPSPPASADDPFRAIDPMGAAWPTQGPVVSPVGTGDFTWDGLCVDDDALRPWCAARWLGALLPLRPPPPALASTTRSLHLVAEHVVGPWRWRQQERIGLRWTLGGFGTPFAPGDRQVRVDDGQLVVQEVGAIRVAPITTLRDAAAFVDLDPVPGGGSSEFTVDLDEPLEVSPDAASWLGDLAGFATRVLEELRVGEPDADRRRVQLWPEHFDVAVDLGDGVGRATFGVSPGDDDHDDPYLYVSAWEPGRLDGMARRDAAFNGVSLPCSDLLDAPDQLDAARAFFEQHRLLLAGGGTG